ncbi:hypothetical protein NEOKW01_0525 [Nematocida sp. AWRm80]|nr:hypothetical protein NEOKW01_0525 [Nematocida sp. AWRm80]
MKIITIVTILFITISTVSTSAIEEDITEYYPSTVTTVSTLEEISKTTIIISLIECIFDTIRPIHDDMYRENNQIVYTTNSTIDNIYNHIKKLARRIKSQLGENEVLNRALDEALNESEKYSFVEKKIIERINTNVDMTKMPEIEKKLENIFKILTKNISDKKLVDYGNNDIPFIDTTEKRRLIPLYKGNMENEIINYIYYNNIFPMHIYIDRIMIEEYIRIIEDIQNIMMNKPVENTNVSNISFKDLFMKILSQRMENHPENYKVNEYMRAEWQIGNYIFDVYHLEVYLKVIDKIESYTEYIDIIKEILYRRMNEITGKAREEIDKVNILDSIIDIWCSWVIHGIDHLDKCKDMDINDIHSSTYEWITNLLESYMKLSEENNMTEEDRRKVHIEIHTNIRDSYHSCIIKDKMRNILVYSIRNQLKSGNTQEKTDSVEYKKMHKIYIYITNDIITNLIENIYKILYIKREYKTPRLFKDEEGYDKEQRRNFTRGEQNLKCVLLCTLEILPEILLAYYSNDTVETIQKILYHTLFSLIEIQLQKRASSLDNNKEECLAKIDALSKASSLLIAYQRSKNEEIRKIYNCESFPSQSTRRLTFSSLMNNLIKLRIGIKAYLKPAALPGPSNHVLRTVPLFDDVITLAMDNMFDANSSASVSEEVYFKNLLSTISRTIDTYKTICEIFFGIEELEDIARLEERFSQQLNKDKIEMIKSKINMLSKEQSNWAIEIIIDGYNKMLDVLVLRQLQYDNRLKAIANIEELIIKILSLIYKKEEVLPENNYSIIMKAPDRRLSNILFNMFIEDDYAITNSEYNVNMLICSALYYKHTRYFKLYKIHYTSIQAVSSANRLDDSEVHSVY